MTALTIGITTARFPECKRGIAVNMAASLARDPSRGRVCVVDADPLTLDVTTRLAVRGPYLEDFAEPGVTAVGGLGSAHEPPLSVLPNAGAGVGTTQRAMERALPLLGEVFDVVVCDLMGGPSGPVRVAGGLGGLAGLDWLLIAVTPDVEPVEATAGFLEHFAAARSRSEVATTVRVGLVITGDEGSRADSALSPEIIGRALGCPVVGSVPQLWGRSVPNLGFGAALGIAELDDAVEALCGQLIGPAGRTDRGFSRVS